MTVSKVCVGVQALEPECVRCFSLDVSVFRDCTYTEGNSKGTKTAIDITIKYLVLEHVFMQIWPCLIK